MEIASSLPANAYPTPQPHTRRQNKEAYMPTITLPLMVELTDGSDDEDSVFVPITKALECDETRRQCLEATNARISRLNAELREQRTLRRVLTGEIEIHPSDLKRELGWA